LTQYRAQQASPDFLAPILQSGAARTIVKGSMAAPAPQLIEPHLDPAALTEPPQATDEFVAGSRGRAQLAGDPMYKIRHGRTLGGTSKAVSETTGEVVEHAREDEHAEQPLNLGLDG
jgi:hypothetical protein